LKRQIILGMCPRLICRDKQFAASLYNRRIYSYRLIKWHSRGKLLFIDEGSISEYMRMQHHDRHRAIGQSVNQLGDCRRPPTVINGTNPKPFWGNSQYPVSPFLRVRTEVSRRELRDESRFHKSLFSPTGNCRSASTPSSCLVTTR